MAFSPNRIGLAAARHIFQGVEFTEVEMGGKVVGYTAIVLGVQLEDRALVHLCSKVWSTAFSRAKAV